jgi:hypothetical protein
MSIRAIAGQIPILSTALLSVLYSLCRVCVIDGLAPVTVVDCAGSGSEEVSRSGSVCIPLHCTSLQINSLPRSAFRGRVLRIPLHCPPVSLSPDCSELVGHALHSHALYGHSLLRPLLPRSPLFAPLVPKYFVTVFWTCWVMYLAFYLSAHVADFAMTAAVLLFSRIASALLADMCCIRHPCDGSNNGVVGIMLTL